MAVRLSWESYVCDARPHYPLLISAKRYWNSSAGVNTLPDAEALTLICTHGAGHHKELWEPTIEYLFEVDARQAKLGGHPQQRRIKEIWSIDSPNHGDAAVLNAAELRFGYSPMCRCPCSVEALAHLR